MIDDIKNWKEVARGIYRYVISAGVAYEIHILYWIHNTDLLDANAKLFIVGEWYEKEKGSFFEREELTSRTAVYTVLECLKLAKIDNEENNKNLL